MKINDELVVIITKQDHNGRGIAKIDNFLVFINKGVVNDECLIKIIVIKKNYAIGEIIKIIKSSPKRIEVNCPYYEHCGGCDFLHVNFNYENEVKVNTIKEVFLKYAQITLDNIEIEVQNNLNYRNKITLHGKNNKLGYYKKNSDEIVEIKECLLANNLINNCLEDLNKLAKNSEIKEVVIRCNNEEVLISIDGKVSSNAIDKYLKNKTIKTIILNNKLIKGKGYLLEEVLGNKFIITNKSFFQINNEIMVKLYEYILNKVKENKYNNILDLYCGTGTIGIILSKEVKQVLGIELNKEAVESALKNKELNNITNIDFINDDVLNTITKIDENLDLIVVDPPRSGLDIITLTNIKRLNPKDIIYVSCDLFTLCRDIKLLSELYDIKEYKFFNMFPRTSHVESVIILKHK
ncbi:MAG: class I SAM-dependent RNA methyltransferase, partial [Bacilli bacterium]